MKINHVPHIHLKISVIPKKTPQAISQQSSQIPHKLKTPSPNHKISKTFNPLYQHYPMILKFQKQDANLLLKH